MCCLFETIVNCYIYIVAHFFHFVWKFLNKNVDFMQSGLKNKQLQNERNEDSG